MFKKLSRSVVALAMIFALLFSSPVLANDEEYEILPFSTEDLEYDYEYDPISTTSILEDDQAAIASAAIALIGGVGLIVFLGMLVISYIYGAWTLMVIAQKLGDSSAWMAWIPILNTYLAFKIAGVNLWLLLVLLVPLANIAVIVYVMMKISERRGFPSWLGILILVPVANIILPAYLAFATPSKK